MKLIDRVTTKMNNTTATNQKFVLDSTDSSTTIVNVRVSVLFEASNTVTTTAVSYTHLRAHETGRNLVCRLLLEKKKTTREHKNSTTTDESVHGRMI